MALGQFLQGRHLTAITIAPVTIVSGVWTVGSATSILAYIMSAEDELAIDLEDIRPVWQLQKNMVETGEGFTLRIGALQRSDSANLITSLKSAGYRYFQVAYLAGTETKTFKGILSRSGGGVQSRGANLTTLDLDPIADGGDVSNLVVS